MNYIKKGGVAQQKAVEMDVDEPQPVVSIRNLWFNIQPPPPPGRFFGGNNDIIKYQEFDTFSYTPLFGIKYEIATQDIDFLVEKYDLGQLEIKNENIDDLLFKQYIDEEFIPLKILELVKMGQKTT